ncbi:uncharacterized protein BDR25DRAFT_92679 [Lindgomyces ingoldianus]|uniref:Uncharacterized protein n=1 Tax=Lindgomyces ingoldianus TaxID=673940 RepID=A0ACB6QG10_9PLEO|nr:uncharacterized protein BDR25DRAFT_92679 [Lindgomyces ingoldianus]KAF2465052.1 hypothetical protein BDR25DRAFT_92679 [Lindgomyces ingoldianus]
MPVWRNKAGCHGKASLHSLWGDVGSCMRTLIGGYEFVVLCSLSWELPCVLEFRRVSRSSLTPHEGPHRKHKHVAGEPNLVAIRSHGPGLHCCRTGTSAFCKAPLPSQFVNLGGGIHLSLRISRFEIDVGV